VAKPVSSANARQRHLHRSSKNWSASRSRSMTASSRRHTSSRAVSPISTRCSTSQDVLATPEGPDRDLDAILLHVGTAGEQQPPPARCRCDSPRGVPSRRCQSGASPSSTQASPSSEFLNALMVADDPDSLLMERSHDRECRATSASQSGCKAMDRWKPAVRLLPSVIARHSPCSSIQVLWCSGIGASQDSQT
jgi:hypothetical protein